MHKENRLTRNRDFQRVYRKGRSFPCPHLVLIALRAHPKAKLVGFSVSKKIGNSVVRNRVKRRLREGFRGLLPRVLPGYCYVVVARTAAAEAGFQDLTRSLTRQLSRGKFLMDNRP